MQIKSWQIAFVGAIPGILLLFLFLLELIMVGGQLSKLGNDVALGLAILILRVVVVGIVLLPTVLLKSANDKTKRIGAILSILLSLAFVEWYIYTGSMIAIAILELVPALSLFVAGIYYFWKKT